MILAIRRRGVDVGGSATAGSTEYATVSRTASRKKPTRVVPF
jgi:hypothetical protein